MSRGRGITYVDIQAPDGTYLFPRTGPGSGSLDDQAAADPELRRQIEDGRRQADEDLRAKVAV